MRNHALHPQPDGALALFLLVPPDDIGAAFAAQRLFNRVRAMKNPARFPGPGLGTLLKDIFLYMNPVATSTSQKLHRSHKLHDALVHQA